MLFDFHIHSTLSFDGKASPESLVKAAEDKGLTEICFTDHMDYDYAAPVQTMIFTPEEYAAAYDSLESSAVRLRKGVEYGLWPQNQEQCHLDLSQRAYDFVLGSVHFAHSVDVYMPEYWEGRSPAEAFHRHMEETLRCVHTHDDFDVLAHLTFLAKSPCNIARNPFPYETEPELIDEILRELVRKGKGLELNTSGLRTIGAFLPTESTFRRFKELGGEIVTVGSDAHQAVHVGDGCAEGMALLKDIFGHVCTFEKRQPVFHKL